MKLLLLQLSDIHITEHTGDLGNRCRLVADAVRALETDYDLVAIVVTGDLAFSGQEGDYLRAVDFLATLRNTMFERLLGQPNVRLVVVPGNHDCDFSQCDEARERLIAALSLEPVGPVSANALAVCTAVQRAFFELRDLLDDGTLQRRDALYYEYLIPVGEEEVLFRCYNTAWASQLHERPGSLLFPCESIPDQTARATLAVSVFHHPYNWLVPEVARLFRKRVEELSDVILTGHEHDFTYRSQRGGKGEVNLYIEGAALFESEDRASSAFNALVFDTALQRQKVIHFEFHKDIYRPNVPESGWEEYHVNRLRSRKQFNLADQWLEELHDLGMTLHHPRKGNLELQDVFVYPDLEEETDGPRERDRLVSSARLSAGLGTLDRTIITGPEKSGKTCLAKRMYLDALDRGFVPLMLKDREIPTGDDDAIARRVREVFSRQYDAEAIDHYMQLDRASRLVIIDDFHLAPPRQEALRRLVRWMTHFAGQVLVLSNDMAQQVLDVTCAQPLTEGGSAFRHYQIVRYGFLKRDELAQKWFSLDPDVAEDKDRFARKLVEAKHMMDTAIGRNFVPSYPVFILAILQAQEHSEPLDLNASSYGYYYELLVKNALAVGATHAGYDVRMGYLAFLAFEMFKRGLVYWGEPLFREVHASYEKKFALKVPFANMQSDLLRCEIVATSNNEFWFKYRYIFYYFVASHLRDHIGEPAVQQQIAALAEHLFDEESANTLLFLAHLSRDPVVIDHLLKQAKLVFTDSPFAELLAGDAPGAITEDVIRQIVFEETAPAVARRALLTRLDQADEERAVREELDRELEEARDLVSRMSVAFKTLQILGQILKNFPGSIEASRKAEIAEACFGVAFRTLGSLLALLRERREDLARSLVETIREENPDIPSEVLSKIARNSVFGFGCAVSFGMIRRLATSIGSPALLQTYDAVRENRPVPSVALTHVSLQLDQAGAFPQNAIEKLAGELKPNRLAHQVLCGLVINHFHLFEVRFDVKQRACAQLGILYRPLQGADPRLRLVGRQGSSGR